MVYIGIIHGNHSGLPVNFPSCGEIFGHKTADDDVVLNPAQQNKSYRYLLTTTLNSGFSTSYVYNINSINIIVYAFHFRDGFFFVLRFLYSTAAVYSITYTH